MTFSLIFLFFLRERQDKLDRLDGLDKLDGLGKVVGQVAVQRRRRRLLRSPMSQRVSLKPSNT